MQSTGYSCMLFQNIEKDHPQREYEIDEPLNELTLPFY